MVCEFATLCLVAKGKLLWCDELISLHLSSLDASSLWRALRDGADGMTVTYYLLIRLARLIPGDPHVILRLPSIAGFLLAMAGVYWFTLRRLPARAALAAALLLALSPFREYALDARCYAMTVGFLAVAAALWQRIDDRRFLTPLFGLFLMLSVSIQTMAVLTIAFFGAAEAAWTFLTRRIRWGVWVSCIVAAVPFLLSLPMLTTYRQMYARHFWSQARWGAVIDAYENYSRLETVATFAVVVAISLFVVAAVFGMRQRTARNGPELLLVGCFLWFPALLVILGKVQHIGFTARYAWPAILGLSLGVVYLWRNFWRGRAAAFALAGLFVAAAVRLGLDLKHVMDFSGTRTDARWTELARLTRGNPELPVVIASGGRYLEASEYAPPELRGRLVMLTDVEAAVRLAGADTVDIEFPILSRFVPHLRVEDRARFEPAHPRFFLYSGSSSNWVTPYLFEKNYHVELLSTPTPNSVIALVTR